MDLRYISAQTVGPCLPPKLLSWVGQVWVQFSDSDCDVLLSASTIFSTGSHCQFLNQRDKLKQNNIHYTTYMKYRVITKYPQTICELLHYPNRFLSRYIIKYLKYCSVKFSGSILMFCSQLSQTIWVLMAKSSTRPWIDLTIISNEIEEVVNRPTRAIPARSTYTPTYFSS